MPPHSQAETLRQVLSLLALSLPDRVLTRSPVPQDPRDYEPVEIPHVDRQWLAALFGRLDFRLGAEIGVRGGAYSEMLCREHPSLSLYAVDPWQAYTGCRGLETTAAAERLFQHARHRLRHLPVQLVRQTSMAAAKNFKPASLDFVYIDADHEFRHVVEDLTEWSARVRPGGIVAGHDYRMTRDIREMHVVEAVRGFTWAHRIWPWFVLGSREDQSRDPIRSFMWVVA